MGTNEDRQIKISNVIRKYQVAIKSLKVVGVGAHRLHILIVILLTLTGIFVALAIAGLIIHNTETSFIIAGSSVAAYLIVVLCVNIFIISKLSTIEHLQSTKHLILSNPNETHYQILQRVKIFTMSLSFEIFDDALHKLEMMFDIFVNLPKFIRFASIILFTIFVACGVTAIELPLHNADNDTSLLNTEDICWIILGAILILVGIISCCCGCCCAGIFGTVWHKQGIDEANLETILRGVMKNQDNCNSEFIDAIKSSMKQEEEILVL